MVRPLDHNLLPRDELFLELFDGWTDSFRGSSERRA
jgi:hypothetical protein